jgi:hypothetical protein
MKKVDEKQGLDVFTSCLKNYARNFLPEEDRKPLNGMEGAWNALSLEIKDMWIGIIYVRNESAESFTYSVKPSLKGAHVLTTHSKDEEDFITMSLDSGTEEIIILKRTEGSVSFGMSTRLQRQ